MIEILKKEKLVMEEPRFWVLMQSLFSTVYYFLWGMFLTTFFYYVYTRANFYGYKNNRESSKMLMLKTWQNI